MIDKNKSNEALPPILGEFSNWAGVMSNKLQTIIDFGFVQPAPEKEQKIGIITRRIILPPEVAKKLGEILINSFQDDKTKKSTKK